jgi:hypothetical protein
MRSLRERFTPFKTDTQFILSDDIGCDPIAVQLSVLLRTRLQVDQGMQTQRNARFQIGPRQADIDDSGDLAHT